MTDVQSSAEWREYLETARELIQEAKGAADGPEGGHVTDHLDFAENWIDRAEDAITSALDAHPNAQDYRNRGERDAAYWREMCERMFQGKLVDRLAAIGEAERELARINAEALR